MARRAGNHRVPRVAEIGIAYLERNLLAVDFADRLGLGVAVLTQGIRRRDSVRAFSIWLTMTLPARTGGLRTLGTLCIRNRGSKSAKRYCEKKTASSRQRTACSHLPSAI